MNEQAYLKKKCCRNKVRVYGMEREMLLACLQRQMYTIFEKKEEER